MLHTPISSIILFYQSCVKSFVQILMMRRRTAIWMSIHAWYLTSLLERSKCALHLTTLRLRMNAGPGEQDMITTLLQATPNLTTLDLELVFVDWRDEIDDYCYNNVADRSIMILLARMHPTQRMSGEGDILFDTILKGVAGSRLAAASLYNERKTWGTDGQLYTVFYNTI